MDYREIYISIFLLYLSAISISSLMANEDSQYLSLSIRDSSIILNKKGFNLNMKSLVSRKKRHDEKFGSEGILLNLPESETKRIRSRRQSSDQLGPGGMRTITYRKNGKIIGQKRIKKEGRWEVHTKNKTRTTVTEWGYVPGNKRIRL